MSDTRHIHVVDDGINSVSKEGYGVYAAPQSSSPADDVAEKGVVEFDERDIRKKQVLLHSSLVVMTGAQVCQGVYRSTALLV